MQLWPSGQRTPAQASGSRHPRTHTSPSRQGEAQATKGTQRSLSGSHTWPSAQRTPWQGTWKQPGTQAPPRQVWPPGHWTQSQGSRRWTHLVTHDWPSAQAMRPAEQKPPQPSGVPQATPAGQCGRQAWQWPAMQLSPARHSGQPQESMQRPDSHTWPAAQVTVPQGLASHEPLTHAWPLGQRTPTQRSGWSHERCGEKPPGHSAPQARSATHWLLAGLQKVPDGHTTPRHGTSKQPGTQAPSMQVWLRGQFTCAQGSVVRTQVARQVVPVGHTEALAQGSATHEPATHTWPMAQSPVRVQLPPLGPPSGPGPPSIAMMTSVPVGESAGAASDPPPVSAAPPSGAASGAGASAAGASGGGGGGGGGRQALSASVAPSSVQSEANSLGAIHRFIGAISFTGDLLRKRYMNAA